MEYLVVLAVVVYVYLMRDVWGSRRRSEEGELPPVKPDRPVVGSVQLMTDELRHRGERGELRPIGYDRQQTVIVQRGGMGPLGAGCLFVMFLLLLFLVAMIGLPMLTVLYAVVKMPIWH